MLPSPVSHHLGRLAESKHLQEARAAAEGFGSQDFQGLGERQELQGAAVFEGVGTDAAHRGEGDTHLAIQELGAEIRHSSVNVHSLGVLEGVQKRYQLFG